jgi:hypothetical protein
MRRSIGLFLLVYGSAMMVLAAILGFEHPDHAQYAVFLGATPAGCILAALGLYRATDTEPNPSKRWMTCILAALLVQCAALFLTFPEVHIDEKALAVESILSLAVFLTFAILFSVVRARRFLQQERRKLRAPVIGAVSAGAVLILLTLGLKTTERASGWLIVAHGAPWITYEYDIARILPEMSAASFMRGIFAAGGYAIYLLALLEAITGIVLTVRWRAGGRQQRRTRWLPWLAGASLFTTFYIYNDVFWGWQSAHWDTSLNLISSVLCPAAGLILWLTALVGTLWVVVRAALQQAGSHQLQILQIAQLPIAGFNFIMMPAYFQGDMFLDFPGLGILMIGSQLLTWGYLGVLQIAENEQAPERANP